MLPRPTASVAAPSARSPRWQVVTDGFAADFTTPGTGPDDWLGRVSRWTTAELTTKLAGTAAERIPAANLKHVTVLAAADAAVDVLAEYDTGLRLVIRAQDGPAGWQITAAQPAQSTPSP